MLLLGLILSVILNKICISLSQDLNKGSFPDDFQFGVATAAYQVEGAWNESDKGEHIWDYLVHNYPELVADGSNGDVACDSYHHINEDVAILKELGVVLYRFSISWTRILPTGFSNYVSETGLEYYNSFIDALIEAGITPMITLYHWDLPVGLQALGGWTNPLMVDYFGDYAEIAYQNFGDRVKHWITFNEPGVFCGGYGSSDHAPVGVRQSGIADYMCLQTMLLSHARAYHLYNDTYKETQKGEVGITLSAGWYEPNSTKTDDVLAAYRMMQFGIGIHLHPIFSDSGDYPEVMKTQIAEISEKQGFPYSRLPEYTEEEIQYLKGATDFVGVNHYTSYMIAYQGPYEIGEPDSNADVQATAWQEADWGESASTWLRVIPWMFTKLLVWFKDEYGNPKIYITENGFSDRGEIEDDGRVNYYKLYLSALLDAIDQGVNVKGYTAWSLMDNFEWLDGYVNRFGIYYVNMSDPERTRIAKKSAKYYQKVIATRKVDPDDTDDGTGEGDGSEEGSGTEGGSGAEGNGSSAVSVIFSRSLCYFVLLICLLRMCRVS